jgi:hypothetical protein
VINSRQSFSSKRSHEEPQINFDEEDVSVTFLSWTIEQCDLHSMTPNRLREWIAKKDPSLASYDLTLFGQTVTDNDSFFEQLRKYNFLGRLDSKKKIQIELKPAHIVEEDTNGFVNLYDRTSLAMTLRERRKTIQDMPVQKQKTDDV